MNRKSWLLAVLFFTSFNLAEAQQPKGVSRIGYLSRDLHPSDSRAPSPRSRPQDWTGCAGRLVTGSLDRTLRGYGGGTAIRRLPRHGPSRPTPARIVEVVGHNLAAVERDEGS